MKYIFLVLQLLPVYAWSQTQTRVYKIYGVGKMQEAPLFIQTTEIQKDSKGGFTSSAKIEDPTGKLIMTEKVQVRENLLVSQEVEQLQSKEAWDLQVKDGQATFRTFKLSESGRQEQGSGKTQKVDNFINGPMMEDFIRQQWDKLAAGDVVKVAFSVLELERTVDFKFEKVKESERLGKKVVVIKMKPANFFISALVDSIFIEFDLTTKKMVYFKGRTPLKVLKSGELKPLDAEILYD